MLKKKFSNNLTRWDFKKLNLIKHFLALNQAPKTVRRWSKNLHAFGDHLLCVRIIDDAHRCSVRIRRVRS